MNLSETLESVDKFYIVFAAILILLAVMVIFSFRGLFSAYLTAYEIGQKDLGNSVRIDKGNMEEADKWVSNKETLPLEIR